MPKATSSRAAAARRHNPLADDITSVGHLRTQSSKKDKRQSQGEDEDGSNGQRFVDAKMSRKILQIGQELADEDAAEQKLAMGAMEPNKSNAAFEFDTRFEDEPLSDDEKFENDEWVDDEVEEVVCSLPDLCGPAMKKKYSCGRRKLIPMTSICLTSSCPAAMRKTPSSTHESPALRARQQTSPI